MFPRYHIIRADANEVFGSVTATTHGSETWVGDERLGYLMGESKFIFGRWHKRGDSWGFVPHDTSVIEMLRPDTEWGILDGYWGERAELVLDANCKWQKAVCEEATTIIVPSAGRRWGKEVNRKALSAMMQRGFAAAVTSRVWCHGHWISYRGRARSKKTGVCANCLKFSRKGTSCTPNKRK